MTTIVVAVAVLTCFSLMSSSSDADAANEYRFYLINSVDGEDSSINGWYSATGENPVVALSTALNNANIANTIDPTAASVWFGNGSISNWSSSWDSDSDELIGAQYAVWNYSAEKGWFLGNTFGTEPETVYMISHENYYSWMGETAFMDGVFYDEEFNFYAPAGFTVNDYGWYQKAPVDLRATPENVVLGTTVNEYNFYLFNTIAGQDSEINGWYTGYGSNPVQALKQVLTYMEIDNKVDYSAATMWFGDKTISDWSSAWDNTATDVFGANYAIWNYSAEKGWFTGNTFGSDPETTYLISHENFLVPTGATAQSYGVTVSEEGIVCPAGLVDSFGMYLQYAPLDVRAAPEDLVFGKIIGVDYVASMVIDGKVQYFETIAAANAATSGDLIKVLSDVTLPAALTLKKDMEVVKGVTLDVAKNITLNAGFTLTIDEGSKVVLTTGQISNKGTVVINGILETSKKNVSGAGEIVGNVTVNPYFAVGETGTFTAGEGTTTHNAKSDTCKYTGDSKVTITYTVTSVPGTGAGSWDNFGTATISSIVFGEDASIVYIPSYFVSKVTIGSETVLCYYKVNELSDEVIQAINGKTVSVFLPEALQGLRFAETVDVSGVTYYTDADGNTIIYHVDETAPVWYNGYTMYTVYANATENADARYCEQGSILAVEFADGMDTFSKKTVQWSKSDAVSSDEYISGNYADMIASVMVADNTKEYTFILNNTVEGEDSTINGTYTVRAVNPVIGLAAALDGAGIEFNFDVTAESIWLTSGSISNWSSSWNSSAADVLGANYAVWNYSAEKGWFTGGTFGTDPETVYYISHENYYVPTGATAKSYGVSVDVDGNFVSPAGLQVAYGMYVQLAPMDLSAAPENVVFGVGGQTFQEYTFILKNSVVGENSAINGTYTGIGVSPVHAIVTALNNAGIKHTIDASAKSIWFAAGSIDNWSSAWNATSTECYGANYAVWNYSAVNGWFLGSSFGTEAETTYLISHENYYVPTGKIAQAMGVTVTESGCTAPAGLQVTYDMYVQLTPMDLSAAPENLVFEPYYVITLDFANGGEPNYIVQKAGTTVTAPAAPVKEGYEFIGWQPAVPTVMPADNLSIVAVWGAIPVVKDNEVDIVLGEKDSAFKMPESASGKEANIVMSTGSVTIADSSALAGKTIVSKVETVQNPTSVKGTAFEFTFEADGTAYNGKMTVTIPFATEEGKLPVVYFVNGSDLVKMNVVSYTDSTVTFETDHNSTYVVSNQAPAKDNALTAVVAVFIAVVIISLVMMFVADRKVE